MTIDEAIEALGGLVSAAGGEGDDALDVFKEVSSAARRALAVLNDGMGSDGSLAWPDDARTCVASAAALLGAK